MILRAKTKTLFSGKELTAEQKANTELNIKELEAGEMSDGELQSGVTAN